MNFRKAKITDLLTLNKISVESKKYWGYPDNLIEKWTNDLTIDEEEFAIQNIVVLEFGSDIAGFCSVIDKPDNYEILHLWLLPKFIGQGYGSKLLDRTLNETVKICKPIIVEADPNAEKFYRKHGFITFDKIESYPKGRYLPVMKKLLPVMAEEHRVGDDFGKI